MLKDSVMGSTSFEPVEIATRIRTARVQAGLTQAQLADRVGAHWVTVSNWETGKFLPALGHLSEIAQATGRPLTWFLESEQAA